HTIDEAWQENLRQLDELKHSVQNASYEQKDPLLIFKLESVTLFDNMIDEVNDGTISVLMRVSLPMPDPEEVESARAEQQPRRPQYVESHGGENYNEPSEVQKAMQKAAGGDTRQRQPSQPIVNQGPKIGRNDPCPCGSGKKYKNCHGKGLV
ncbi:MAG: SEC-C metal-binding domain-containing protein, partial [Bacteroidales bacterium]|nr:SEC-C metal-binding domain-containing protein [Bacteroidales bacterium]